MKLKNTNRIFVIAEVANTHEGNFSIAKQIINVVAKTGADAIKFQIFSVDELVEKNHPKYHLFQKLEFSKQNWTELIKYARKKHLQIFADVFGKSGVKLGFNLKLDGYKIHTSDLTNPILLDFLSNSKKPLLLSTAGALPNEIKEAIKILGKKSNEIILMHGFQGYPTKIEDLNLARILTLKEHFGLPVGIMDHISGDSKMAKIIPLIGIGLGALIIEKHIILERNSKKIDYFSSLNPEEFTDFVTLVRTTQKAMGSKEFVLPKNEIKYRLEHKKNSIANKEIQKNKKLRIEFFDYKRTKKKLNSLSYFDFDGKISTKKIKQGEILTHSMIIPGGKIAAVIACRVESDRLFAKPLQLIGKFSILQLLIKQLQTSQRIDDIVLAVSERAGNEAFLEFASKNQIKAITGDDEDVLKRLIDGANYVNADIIFRVTSENPYLYWEGIDKVIQKHIDGNYDFSFVEEIPIGSGFEVINLEAFKKSHKLGRKKHRSELCSLYIHEHQKSFKIQSIKPPKELRKPKIRLTVDTPEDLMVARIIHNSLGKNDNPIPLSKILKLLDKNPEITKINSGISLGVTRIWP